MAQGSEIALLCFIHPTSEEARSKVCRAPQLRCTFNHSEQVLKLLPQAYPYHSPSAKTTTWTYFRPSSRKGAPSQLIKAKGVDRSTFLAGFEVYTDKSALSAQLEHPEFKKFHELTKKENLYSKDEELVAWYRRGGFYSRGETSKAGSGVSVVTAIFELKEENQLDKALEILVEFTKWVKENEPGVLTYAVLARPKAPKEILMFERYASLEAFKQHGSSKEFKEMGKKIFPLSAKVTLNEWEEVDGSFVGNVPGGKASGQAKI